MNEIRERLERLADAPAYSSADGVFERAQDRAAHIRHVRARRRGVSFGAVIVAVTIVVALVVRAQPGDHGLGIKATRPAGGTSSSIAASTTTTTTSTAAAPTLSGCTHKPTLRSDDYYFGVPPPKAPSIVFSADSGSDGRGNTISEPGLAVEKTGPAGTVTLTHGRSYYDIVLRGFGDFDGDGRTDVVVDLTATAGFTDTYIVPGTLGPGTYDPAVFGVAVPHPAVDPGGIWAFPAVVGDQNRDGADDLGFGRRVYSGRVLMSAHAGAPLSPPILTLPSDPVGLLEVDPAAPPAFVEADRATRSFEVLDHRSDRLLLDATDSDMANLLQYGAPATGWLVNARHIVQLSYGTRTFGTTWRWDLDAPCGG